MREPNGLTSSTSALSGSGWVVGTAQDEVYDFFCIIPALLQARGAQGGTRDRAAHVPGAAGIVGVGSRIDTGRCQFGPPGR